MKNVTWAQLRKTHPGLPKSSKGWHKHKNGGPYEIEAYKAFLLLVKKVQAKRGK